MEFTKTYNELKSIFSLNVEKSQIVETEIEIRFLQFTSKSCATLPFDVSNAQASLHNTYAETDESITENKTFKYPIFLPNANKAQSKAIILLHGLNERSWVKYLPWAYYLVQATNRPVILFPIAFHINRSPESWANPRAMLPILNSRQQISNIELSTFANAALSQRLSDNPLRFFLSGKQSADDIIHLLKTIQNGDYPFLEKNAQVDFFSYSIGAFLSQILFLANPNGLLDKSRLFMFCGGAHFCDMNGTSRLIMDSHAYTNLIKYYLCDFLDELKTSSPLSKFINGSNIGEAFISMISPECKTDYRNSRLEALSNRIRIVSLKKDMVIPSNNIQSTFACTKSKLKSVVNELDFPYTYSHEVPFPVYNNPQSMLVDQCFEKVFRPAADFLI